MTSCLLSVEESLLSVLLISFFKNWKISPFPAISLPLSPEYSSEEISEDYFLKFCALISLPN